MAFGESFSEAKITLKDGVVVHVEAPLMPDLKDDVIVDRAVSYVAGNATLFVYDGASGQFVRRSTNVKKENGDRAVGTQLAPDHPGQAALRRGEAYKGPAKLFGKSFMTAYYPVVSAAGKVIGILYVGIAMEQLDAMMTEALYNMLLARRRRCSARAARNNAFDAARHETVAFGDALADCNRRRKQ